MASSLHVSLPDAMRAYVDSRTNGENAYATPSEYVRALIRDDMEKEAQRLYVFRELLQSAEEIKNGQTYAAGEVAQHMDAFIEGLDQEDGS